MKSLKKKKKKKKKLLHSPLHERDESQTTSAAAKVSLWCTKVKGLYGKV